MTAEQQGSDESGGGLDEAIRAGLRKCRVEDGAPVPLIRESDLSHITYMVTAELVPFMAALATARREVEEMRAERDEWGRIAEQRLQAHVTAAAERDDLRARLGAVEALDITAVLAAHRLRVTLHDGCFCACGWSVGRGAGASDAHEEHVAENLRAALANPSAAQGGGEAGAEAQIKAEALREAADEMVGRHGTNPAARFLRARADSLATPAPEADQ